MHKEFPKLFAEICADGTGRDELWNGVASFAQKFERARAEVLARLAFATKPPAAGHRQEDLETALGTFHNSLSDAYPSFVPGGRNDQILAAAALLQMFGKSSVAADRRPRSELLAKNRERLAERQGTGAHAGNRAHLG